MKNQDRSFARTDGLITAARQLQKEKPIEAIKVADIVERAGYSVGSFYLSFSSVEEMWAEFLTADLDGAEKPLEVVARYMPSKMAAALLESLP